MESVSERWLPVKGFEGIYEVSDQGRVRSVATQRGSKWLPHVLKQKKSNRLGNYREVTLSNSRTQKRIRMRIHRLVMQTFVGESHLQVNHKNLDPADNRLENLEYCTLQENIAHAVAAGRYANRNVARGEKQHNAKLTVGIVRSCRLRAKTESISSLAREFDVSTVSMSKAVNRVTWKHVTATLARKTRYVHRLVLEAFVGPCPDNMEARHFPDNDVRNNRLVNLQWSTTKANIADKIIHGTHGRGEKNYQCKLTDDKVRSIRADYASGERQVDLADKHGVTRQLIWRIVNRKCWSHLE